MGKLLQDRVVIVLGVGPSLGHSTAMMCTEEGASVVLAARGQEMLETVAAEVAAKGGAAHTVAMDMTSSADCKRLVAETVERFGRVDGLVCIAYKHHDSKLITESDDDLAGERRLGGQGCSPAQGRSGAQRNRGRCARCGHDLVRAS